MTPTPEEIDAAKKWVLENIDNAYGFEGTAEHVWLSDWLAEYAAHCTAEKDAEIASLREKVAWSLGRLADEALKVGQLKVLLETAVDDYESHNGRPKNANHWTHKARAALDGEKADG